MKDLTDYRSVRQPVTREAALERSQTPWAVAVGNFNSHRPAAANNRVHSEDVHVVGRCGALFDPALAPYRLRQAHARLFSRGERYTHAVPQRAEGGIATRSALLTLQHFKLVSHFLDNFVELCRSRFAVLADYFRASR